MQAEFLCASCRTPFLNRHPLDEHGNCPLCRLGLSGFDAVYTYGSYEGTLQRLIHLFKYEKLHPLARPLAAMLARAIPREERFDAVVPMPLHWRRRWERGFNQSELLAREIARRWNVPVVRAIRRVKATAPQAGLTNAKRRLNLAGAFAVRRSRLDAWSSLLNAWISPLNAWTGGRFSFGKRPIQKSAPLKGTRVLLIDDVLTTGATAAACARALKRAGARHVTLAAVARTDRRIALLDFRADTDAGMRGFPGTASAEEFPGAASAARAGGEST